LPSDPLILAFDTSAAHCAAALLSGDKVLATRVQEMSRGQAEALFPLLEETLSAASVTWQDLSRIGVGIGPGNFTGIRISVSAARGLAVSLGIPAVGISSLEVQFSGTPIAATVAAPRDQLYLQTFTPDASDPELMAATEAGDVAKSLGIPLAATPAAEDLVTRIAQRALLKPTSTSPAPLYIRAADAAPPRDPAPVILP
jgi:tRNA threonylcarbamoyl adenosine modification protein YeaZ